MNLTKAIFVLVFLTTVVWSKKLTFHNFKVFSVKVQTEEQLKVLNDLETDEIGYSYWREPILGRDADIVVPPNKLSEFDALVDSLNLNSTLKVSNIQQLIDAETPKRQSRAGFGWENYHTLDEINSWLDELLETYPDILTVHHVGYSYQNREIRAIKLSHKENSGAILIEGNIHARIGCGVSRDILIDLNRNFDFMWMHVGASSNPCSDTFAGPVPFSDPETKALSEFMTAHIDELKVFITYHSYGQYILHPFAYTLDPAENDEQLKQVGNAGADAIRQRYGTNYLVGSSAEVLYMNSGSSRDWIKGIHNINISFTIELRDQGNYGFILPPEQIIPNCLEQFDGLKAIIRECRSIGYL